MSELRQALYDQCLQYVQTRMDAAGQGIREAQAAVNDDTKSSAGDKYETGREMMQQETNRNLAQLNEANKLKTALNFISTSGTSASAEPGSVVITDQGNFYLAIGAGILKVNGIDYYAVSPASPIGLQLKGKKPGEEFSVNGKVYRIKSIE